MITPKLPHIYYGGDYNPEQWPENVWSEDMRLMKQAGVNLVTIGVFSWAKLQSAPDRFHFEWLDRVMDLLADNGICADLATATASPPPWLTRLYPEILPIKDDGTRLWHGARQQFNPSSRAYRDASATLVRQMATRYKDHPALALWHINNEYACSLAADYSDETAEAFRDWLKARYPTLEALNEAWTTAFWSQTYYDWSEIIPPRQAPMPMPYFLNSGLVLDYKRFMSDAFLACHVNEERILREITPAIPITTNLMGTFGPLDYVKWAKHVDFTSHDCYPDPSIDPYGLPLTHDFTRSLKPGVPFVLMEQVTTHVQWRPRNVTKSPGTMRLWSYQAIARGADGIMFFQWRQSRGGVEKYHGAMVGHSGDDSSRCYRESAGLGGELTKLDGIVGSRVESQTAILFDYDNWWAFELPSKPSNELKYMEEISAFYWPLFHANLAIDFAFLESDLSRYKLLIAPTLYMVKAGVAEKLEEFVQAGGTLVVTFLSGIVDENDRVHLGGYPGPLRRLLGLCVEEWAPMTEDQTNRIHSDWLQADYKVGHWAEVIHTEGAEVLARFARDYYAGSPAVTLNRVGDGRAYYIGTKAEPRFYADLLGVIAAESNLKPPISAPIGVEVAKRCGDEASYLFILNHLEHTVDVTDERLSGMDLLTGKELSGRISLDAKGVAVVQTRCDSPSSLPG